MAQKVDNDLEEELRTNHHCTSGFIVRGSVSDSFRLAEFIEKLSDSALIYQKKSFGRLFITSEDQKDRRRYT